MKTPHKYAELIKAWADGAEIEYKYAYHSEGWRPAKCPNWDAEFVEYRIKPEPKPDITFYGRAVLTSFDTPPIVGGLGNTQSSLDTLKLTFDGETGKLKSAEVL